jgi:hypothetical protein
MPEQKKRVWITYDKSSGGWIHSERPEAYNKSLWCHTKEFTVLTDTVMKIIGLRDIKPNELIEIEVVVKSRTTLEEEFDGKEILRWWTRIVEFAKSKLKTTRSK